MSALVRWEGRDVDIGEPWEDSWQPVAQGWMSQDQIGKARAMEAAKYGVSGNKRGPDAGGSVARASNLEAAARAGGWRTGKLRARDASGRAVREARPSGTDELRDMMAAKRAKVAGLAAMRERVGAEMAAAMDTGVRMNVALAQALGVEVPDRLRPEDEARDPGDEASSDTSSAAADESDSEGFEA